jgi:hypothetical protein
MARSSTEVGCAWCLAAEYSKRSIQEHLLSYGWSDHTGTLQTTASVTCCWCVAAAVAAAAVSRYICRSELYEFDLAIDINIDIYPLKVGRALAALQLQPHLAA